MDDFEDPKIIIRLQELERELLDEEEHAREVRAKRALWLTGLLFWGFIVPLTIVYGYYSVAILLATMPILIKYAVGCRVK